MVCLLLSESMPSSSTEEENKEVSAWVERNIAMHIIMIATLEQKAKVGKYAAENGTINAIRHFAKEMPNLKDSTWKTTYLRELAIKVKVVEEDLAITAAEKGQLLL